METKKAIFPLGFGCMRFPLSEPETEKLVLHAISEGVNYFDTALMYGNSEAKLGRILEKHNLRERVMIATKVPPFFIRKPDDLDKYLNQSLRRLRTDYIDYYLIHMMSDFKMWERLTARDIVEWVSKQKATGKIRNFGFSFHGGFEEFARILDAHPWDFCLIQYNYLDRGTRQSAGSESSVPNTSLHSVQHDDALHYAYRKNIPAFIMSPLKGGRLVDSLPKEAQDIFAEPRHINSRLDTEAALNQCPDSSAETQSSKEWTPEEWALRWLWNQPEVGCVLSGMSSMTQLQENIRIAKSSYSGMLTESDHKTIARARKAIIKNTRVSCTGCNYCLPCPRGVDIPTCLISYNSIGVDGRIGALRNYITHTSLKAKPQTASLCNQCGRCEAKCPQEIEIRTELARVEQSFEKFYFKPIVALAKRIMKL